MSHPIKERGPKQPLHPDITPEMIEQLVLTFYEKVRNDQMIGPIFNRIIKDNWPTHLERMCVFWGAIMLKTGAYKGRPVPKHTAIENLTPDHFKRWLSLFRQTARGLNNQEIADIFIDRAERIAESLQLACFCQPGLAPKHTFKNGEWSGPWPLPARS